MRTLGKSALSLFLALCLLGTCLAYSCGERSDDIIGPKKKSDVANSDFCNLCLTRPQGYTGWEVFYGSKNEVCCKCNNSGQFVLNAQPEESPPPPAAPAGPSPVQTESSSSGTTPIPTSQEQPTGTGEKQTSSLIPDSKLTGYVDLQNGPGIAKDGYVVLRTVVKIDGAPAELTFDQMIAATLACNNVTTVPWYFRAQQPSEPGQLPDIPTTLTGKGGARRLLQLSDCLSPLDIEVVNDQQCISRCNLRSKGRPVLSTDTYSTSNSVLCCTCEFGTLVEEASPTVSAPTSPAPEVATPVEAPEAAPVEEVSTPSPVAEEQPTTDGVFFFADTTIKDGQLKDVMAFMTNAVNDKTFERWLTVGGIPNTGAQLLFLGAGDIIFGATTGLGGVFGTGEVEASTPPPDTASSTESSGSTDLGLIIGIVVGVVAAIAVVAAIIAFVASSRKKKSKDINSELLTHRWRLERELGR